MLSNSQHTDSETVSTNLECAFLDQESCLIVVVQQRATRVSKSVRDSRKLCSNSSSPAPSVGGSLLQRVTGT
eukprot:8413-Heterococcus_DN1.PRE.1